MNCVSLIGSGFSTFRGRAPLAGPNVSGLHSPFLRARARQDFSGRAVSLKDLLITRLHCRSALTLAALWVAARFLGEKLFGHWLDGRLQRQKEAHEVRLAELKSEQDRQIEKLRGDIGHLQDRGKHSNEREYAATAEIWEKFVDMYHATRVAISGSFQYPDLERMSESALASFLENEDALTREQKTAVVDAENKSDKFSRFINTNNIIKAQHTNYDFRQLIDKRGIFIPKTLKEQFEQGVELCSAAIEQRYAERNGAGLTANYVQEFLGNGPSAFEALKKRMSGQLLFGDRDQVDESETGGRSQSVRPRQAG